MNRRAIGVALALAAAAFAAAPTPGSVRLETDVVPGRMNLQGYLTDDAGNPIEGARGMMFRVYRDNVLQWEENQDVTIQAGLFRANMGAVTAIPLAVFASGLEHEFELVVAGQALSPRVPLTATSFAFRSARLDRPLSPALDSAEIGPGAVTMEKIDRAGASTGQVLTWNGGAWAPASGGGGGVTSVAQGSGVACVPNPITSTGTVHLDTGWVDDRYIRNQAEDEQAANFMIAGAGQAQQFAGISAAAAVPGIYGDGVSHCSGVYGTADADSWAGVTGDNAATDGVGVYGYGDFAGTAGVSDNVDGSGLFGANGAGAGTGVMAAGNGEVAQYLEEGSGGAFTGSVIGMFGYCANSSGDRGGGYFTEPNGGFAWVAANIGGVSYKIGGSGQVSTSMATRAGERSLFAPEMPEPWFEDVGRARLVAGHCRVDLDPLFADCVTIDGGHPLNVFVTLNGPCNGVWVESDEAGFDVHELGAGTSSAEFTWRALGRWKGHEDLRMPPAPRRLELRAADAPALNRRPAGKE